MGNVGSRIPSLARRASVQSLRRVGSVNNPGQGPRPRIVPATPRPACEESPATPTKLECPIFSRRSRVRTGAGRPSARRAVCAGDTPGSRFAFQLLPLAAVYFHFPFSPPRERAGVRGLPLDNQRRRGFRQPDAKAAALAARRFMTNPAQSGTRCSAFPYRFPASLRYDCGWHYPGNGTSAN